MEFVTLLANVTEIGAKAIFSVFDNGIVNIALVTLIVNGIVSKKIKPIKDDVEDAKEFMEKHDGILTQLFDNESFNRTLERTIESHVLFLGKDVKYKDARSYIIFIGSLIKTFACDVLLLGIESIKDETVSSKAVSHVVSAKQKCAKLFGIKWTEKYYKKYSHLTEDYINDVCHISDDITNDKQMRFRTITVAYAQKIMSNFVREYLQEIKSYETS